MRTSQKSRFASLTTMAGVLLVASAAFADNTAILAQRQALLDTVRQEGVGAVPALIEALEHESELIHRTAAHLLVRLGEPAREGLEAGLRNPDYQVRRIIMRGLDNLGLFPNYWDHFLMDTHPAIRREVQLIYIAKHPLPTGEALDGIIGRLVGRYDEGDEQGRRHVVETISALDEIGNQGRRLLVQAASDEEGTIRESAFSGIRAHISLEWPEARALLEAAEADERKTIRDMAFELYLSLLSVKKYALPSEPWRFALDPNNVGRDQGWYQVDFDDAGWQDDAVIETHWGNFLDDHYLGTAWYRRTITVPAAEGWETVLMHFGGVDEGAWVWLNGTFVGEHDIGPGGWDVPFQFDVSEKVRPGEDLHVTIRAANTAGGGGVWRPVRLLFMRDWPAEHAQ